MPAGEVAGVAEGDGVVVVAGDGEGVGVVVDLDLHPEKSTAINIAIKISAKNFFITYLYLKLYLRYGLENTGMVILSNYEVQIP